MAKVLENRTDPKFRDKDRHKSSALETLNSRAKLRLDTKSQAEIGDVEPHDILEDKISDAVKRALEEARQDWEKETASKLAEAEKQFSIAEKARLAKIKVDLVRDHHAALAKREAYWESELERIRPSVRNSSDIGNAGDLSQDARQSRSALPAVLLLVFLGVSAAYLFEPQWKPTVRSALQPLLASAHVDTKQTIYRLAPWLLPADIVVGVPAEQNVNAPAIPQEQNVYTVNAARLNLRAEPTLRSKVLRTLDKGAQVRQGERNGDWVHVSIPDAKVGTGWVHQSFLRVGGSSDMP
jgi:hypothetical protein